MGIIKLADITKKYRNNLLYKNINLSVEKGETIGIIGANGSGKSVLFKLITGLEQPDSGEVIVNNDRIGIDRDFPDNVGILVNQPGYIEYYSGFKNLKLLAGIKNIINDEDIKKYMRRVGLDPTDKTMVKNYSTGMKQKLGIAQAIMENQEIILLDEPFNALDFQTNRDIMNLLYTLKSEGKTLILTSHQHEYLDKICSKMYIIANNQLTYLDDQAKKAYFEYNTLS